jgi:hypothetical protein
MALRYLMDHNVGRAITLGLRRRGLDVLTAYEDGSAELEDEDLLQRATDLGRVLFSQDEDPLDCAARWQAEGRPFAGLAYSHQRLSIGECVRDLELMDQTSGARGDERQSHLPAALSPGAHGPGR